METGAELVGARIRVLLEAMSPAQRRAIFAKMATVKGKKSGIAAKRAALKPTASSDEGSSGKKTASKKTASKKTASKKTAAKKKALDDIRKQISKAKSASVRAALVKRAEAIAGGVIQGVIGGAGKAATVGISAVGQRRK